MTFCYGKGLITETERVTAHPCVVVQVPKKNASVMENNKGIRLISWSHIQSSTCEDELRLPAQKGFVSNFSEFQEKINDWKGPETMLNKRLERKFFRSHFENLILLKTPDKIFFDFFVSKNFEKF